MNNIGSVLMQESQNKEAIDQYHSSLKISEKIGYYLGSCEALESLASLYYNIGKTKDSIDCIKKSLKIRNQIGYKDGIQKTIAKMEFIRSGNKMAKLELQSSPVNNNLFPSKDIRMFSSTESNSANFSLVNNIVDEINKSIKSYSN